MPVIDPSCPFCELVISTMTSTMTGTATDEPDGTEIVWRSDEALAFLDRSPLFYGHTLVVPTTHVTTLADLDRILIGPFFEVVQRIAAVMPAALGAQGTFVANNNTVSQSVAHLHVHVVPRVKGDGLRGFFWPRQRPDPGRSAAAAAALRAALK